MARTSPTQRLPSELLTLYAIEDAHDIITEGRHDARIVRWYLNETGVSTKNVLISAVDDRVQISRSQVEHVPGETVGARGRVVALANIARHLSEYEENLTCIIDRDRDSVLDRLPFEANSLVRTDFGSMDVYAFQDRPLGQFMALASDSRESANPGSSLNLRRVLAGMNESARLPGDT